MDGAGRQGQEVQRQMMDQQQQQGGWYGAAQHNPYHVSYKWPPQDSSMMHYGQPPGQPYTQPEYYMQHQQYAHGLHQNHQTQHPGHMYVQQEQVWPGHNGWSQPQPSYQASATGSGAEEEDWAAKARAWAAAKAAQEAAAQQAQLQAQAQAQAHAQAHVQAVMSQPEQQYQEYQQQPAQRVQEAGRTPSLQPPGQEASHSFSQDTAMVFGQEAIRIPRETTASAYGHEDAPPSFTEEGAPSTYTQAGQAQVVPSSYSQDVSSSYGQDTAHAAPPGTEQLEQPIMQAPRPPPAPVLQQQQSQPSPVPAQVPHVSHTQPFSYQESVQAPPFDFHQQQQFDFQQPASQDYQQQPSTPYIPPAPSVGLESSEMNFGGVPNGMPVWPPLGGPGISYPPGVGPGGPGSLPGPQFDHTHPPHHNHPMHGHHPPNIFPRAHGPPHGPGYPPGGPPIGGPFGFGASPSLGQGPGAGVGPVFLPDSNGNMVASDRPKKAPVPSWLREELLKKKAVVGTSSLNVVPMPEDIARANGTDAVGGLTHSLGPADRTRSDSSGPSDNEEDDEDEVEAARVAQMNQEIKRVLTEVLLKVTDDLFDEIAQEVIDEDDEAEEGHHPKPSTATGKEEVLRSNSSPSPPAAPSLTAPARVLARVLVAPTRRNNIPSEDDSGSVSSGAPVVNVLGLASYASDDEDGERVLDPNSTSKEREVIGEIQQERGQAEERTSEQKRPRASQEDSKFAERKAEDVPPVGSEDKEKEMGSEKDKAKGDGATGRKDKEKEKKERPSKDADEQMDKKEGRRDRKEKERDNAKESERRIRDKVLDSGESRRELVSDPKGGRKRSNDDSISSDKDIRSPRRSRYGDAERVINITDQSPVEKADADVSRRQNNSGNSRSQGPNDVQGHSTLRTTGTETPTVTVEREERSSDAGYGLGVSRKDMNRGDAKLERHVKESKPRANDEVGTPSSAGTKGRMESGETTRKIKDADDISKEHERTKHRSRDSESERSKGKTLEKERDRESDKLYNKEKLRDSERSADRDRSKPERGRDRGRTHEKERRKGEKERSDRGREKRKESRESRRNKRRSSSASSRGRSPSSSRGSSSADDRSRSPQQRKFGRSSRRHSVSRSPVRVRRRRSSRSRSRSPPSKYSHRRHSPSPSRESDRHR